MTEFTKEQERAIYGLTEEEFLREQIRLVDSVIAGVDALRGVVKETMHRNFDWLDRARERRAREAAE